MRHPNSPCRTRLPSWTKQGRQAQKDFVRVGESHNPRSLLRSCRPYMYTYKHLCVVDSVCRGCTDNPGYIQATSCCLLRLLWHWWLVFYHLPTWISDCILEALHTFERRKFLRGTSFAMKASLEWSTLSSLHWILGNARWGPCPHPRENMRSFTHCGFANIVPSIRSQPVLLAGPLVDRLLRQTPSPVHVLKYISVRPGSPLHLPAVCLTGSHLISDSLILPASVDAYAGIIAHCQIVLWILMAGMWFLHNKEKIGFLPRRANMDQVLFFKLEGIATTILY